jgi:hypothetical protein
MPNTIQAGTILVKQSTLLQSLGVESEIYSENWRSLGILESSGLDQKVRAAGWHLFFMAGELRAVVPAWGGQNTLRRGVKRLLAQTQVQHFNCLEVSHILKKHFLRHSVCVHSRTLPPPSGRLSDSIHRAALPRCCAEARGVNRGTAVIH